jgi:chromosome segregation ATPase
MRRIALLGMLMAANGLSQTTAKDPDALQALLVEVRQLRQDIEGMTVASQRVQIALYGLQMQDAAVARLAQRLDEARNKRMGAEVGRDRMAGEIKKLEDSVASGNLKGVEHEALQERLAQLKSEVERSTAEVQKWEAAEAEASSQYQREQAKLGEIQDRIERLDKVLEKIGVSGK